MSTFTVNFGNTTSPKHKVNKDFTTVKTVTGSVVYPSSVDNPRIKVRGGYINCNYAKGLYDRSYWVVNQVLNEGFNYVELVSDAISSFSGNIYGSNQYVCRSATDFNLAIPDNLLPIEVGERPQVRKFGTSGLKTTESYIIGLTRCNKVNNLTNGYTHKDLVTDPNDPNDTPHVE